MRVVQGYPVPGNWKVPLEDDEGEDSGGKALPK
jgi:hypothetical protein